MEKLTTEKQTLGFFGALCGVMISQLPELRLGAEFSFGSASLTLGAIMALVLTVSFIRRGLSEISNGWMIVCLIAFLLAALCLARSEVSEILISGITGLTPESMQTLLLKFLLMLYLVSWSALAHFDR